MCFFSFYFDYVINLRSPMIKQYLLITLLLSVNFAFAQRYQQAYLLDEKTDRPIRFFPIALPNKQMTYTDWNGMFLYPPNAVLEFKHPLYHNKEINTSQLASSLHLRKRAQKKEEVFSFKKDVINIDPFYKKVFKDRKNVVQTLALPAKNEFLSKVVFDTKYYNLKIKTVRFRLINNTDDYKNTTSYIRLNVYDINKKLLYSSSPISLDATKNVEVAHELERHVFIDLIGLYFGIEIIGMVNEDGSFYPTHRAYLSISRYLTHFTHYTSEYFTRPVTDPYFYKLNNPNDAPNLKIFGFDLQ